MAIAYWLRSRLLVVCNMTTMFNTGVPDAMTDKLIKETEALFTARGHDDGRNEMKTKEQLAQEQLAQEQHLLCLTACVHRFPPHLSLSPTIVWWRPYSVPPISPKGDRERCGAAPQGQPYFLFAESKVPVRGPLDGQP